MSHDDIEEMIEEMYSLADEFGAAASVASELESRLEEMYDEISSIIEEHDCDIELHKYVHVHDHYFMDH